MLGDAGCCAGGADVAADSVVAPGALLTAGEAAAAAASELLWAAPLTPAPTESTGPCK
jgi:hypothetical protein